VGVVRLSQVLGLGAVEMRAFDCMRRVRAREVVARAYGDAGIRCADRTARRYRACAVQWIGSWAAGRLWCAGESWPSCTEEGRRSAATRFKLGAAASKSTLRFVEDASRPQVAAPQPHAAQPQAGRRPRRSAQGLLGDSGGCDAAGAAAAELAARHSRRRWREFPVGSSSARF